MLTELTRIATTPLPRVYSSLLLLLLGGVVARSRYIGSQGSHTAEDMSNMLDSSGNLWNGETVPRDLARGVLDGFLRDRGGEIGLKILHYKLLPTRSTYYILCYTAITLCCI